METVNNSSTETVDKQQELDTYDMSILLSQLANFNLQPSPSSRYHLIGRVSTVSREGFSTIQSTERNFILNFDTPVFICRHNAYELLGEVDEVFGEIGGPMYCVRSGRLLGQDIVDSFAFIMPTHPQTKVLRVERTGEQTYRVA